MSGQDAPGEDYEARLRRLLEEIRDGQAPTRTEVELQRELDELKRSYNQATARAKEAYVQRRKIAFVALIGSSAVMVLSIYFLLTLPSSIHNTFPQPATVSEREFRTAVAAAYNKGVESAKHGPQKASDTTSLQLRDLDSRVKAIEGSLGGRADQILSVPLLRKDVNAVDAKVDATKESLTAQLTQLSALLYFIGTCVVTGTITIIGAAVAQLLKKKPDVTILDGGRA